MSMTINQQIALLNKDLSIITAKVADLSRNVEEKEIKPHSKVGALKDESQNRPSDIVTGFGQLYGNFVPWNDADLSIPPYNQRPPTPTEGYNRHSHSRYSGGAMDINTLELVEYDIDWDADDFSKHSQQFWRSHGLNQPPIKKMDKTSQGGGTEQVEMIGTLELEFNPDTQKWGFFTIDVEKIKLVKRDANGDIEQDSKGNDMSAPLYSSDKTKTCIVWDENGECWRFYATYAEDPES